MNTDSIRSSPTILVVDDDPSLLKLMGMLLEHIGTKPVLFPDGITALDYLKDNTPHLIILDLMLPDINGLDVLRILRRMEHLNWTPVLILTAYADPDFVRQAMQYGADSYVTKPYLANSLIEHVRLLLNVGHRPSKSVPPPHPDEVL
ncbi:response regulator [Aggregatilinea lenta]|uniref:response regulator n=1 Tax=Aggregatilinea lenta TaxID=913108 RepID=UPI0013C2E3A9|nr:response regulator [Aggregatilinea lenta]